MVRDGLAAWDILRQVLANFSPMLLDEMPVRFACRCSRERVQGIIVALGAEEVERLLEKEGRISAACEFCAEQYVIGSEEARALVAKRTKLTDRLCTLPRVVTPVFVTGPEGASGSPGICAGAAAESKCPFRAGWTDEERG